MQNFRLKLLNQHWIQGSTDPNGEPDDVTSHGNILLEINGEDISGCKLLDNELGINQSAVALLQSVFIDHKLDEGHIKHNPMFFHGCSIFGSCPNRIIDFRVRHIKNEVTLDHFIVTGTDLDSTEHYEKKVTIPNYEYAQQILAFGEESFRFLLPGRGDDYETSAYSNFREEHEILVNLVKDYLKNGRISASTRRKVKSFDVGSCSRRYRWQILGLKIATKWLHMKRVPLFLIKSHKYK